MTVEADAYLIASPPPLEYYVSRVDRKNIGCGDMRSLGTGKELSISTIDLRPCHEPAK
jgi:hypothetical protein